MVITSLDQLAVTPAGKSIDVPIPVAPVVAMVISVSAVLTQSVGSVDGVAAVLTSFTVIVPVALTVPHPPVNGIESVSYTHLTLPTKRIV